MCAETRFQEDNHEMDFLWIPIEKVCKITPRRLELLHEINIFSIYDMISHFPRKYEDWRTITKISDILDDNEVTIFAEVSRVPSLHRKGKLSVLRTTLSDSSGAIAVVWFNQPYYSSMLKKGTAYFFRGVIKRNMQNAELINPVFQSADILVDQTLRPIYKTVKGLNQKILREWKKDILLKMKGKYYEPIPYTIVKKRELCSAEFAYENIHFPIDESSLRMAQERLAYEELFMFLTGLRFLKRDDQNNKCAHKIFLNKADSDAIKQCIDALPFDLTEDQKKAVKNILQDINHDRPMNRLLQGDVGSGKTIVAAIAMHACAQKGFQSVFLVPTSVLAQQHYRAIKDYLASDDIVVDLLLGSTKDKDRKEIRQRLKEGTTKILIGTHAVFSEKEFFKNLALLVTDEQHRFGVRQRALLKEDEHSRTHTLVMSATPIPRTLGLIMYADMDISVIKTRPGGRQKIETYLARTQQMDRVLDIAKRQIEKGRQVYYVCPTIEDNEDDEMPAAQEVFSRFSDTVFEKYSVGLLHGALKPSDKEEMMRLFSDRYIDILVSTTVVEVGVDNPNASLMIIDHAESFGLSTLHQLRGRVGRGPHRSVCILISDTNNKKAIERLKYLCSTTDGFALAQKDLETRGPGDFFGATQHGLPQMRFAQFYTNMTEIESISHEVDDIMNNHPEQILLQSDDWNHVFDLKFSQHTDYKAL